MKKILWLTFIFVLLFVGHSFAVYNLTVTPKGVNVTAELTGVPNNNDIYKLVLQTDNFDGSDTYTGKAPSAIEVPTNSTLGKVAITGPVVTTSTGSVKWSIINLKASTTYYARVVDFPAKGGAGKFITSTVLVKTGSISIPIQPLSTAVGDGGSITVSGKVNIDKIPDFSKTNFTAVLYYTETAPASTTTSLTDGRGPLRSEDSNGKEGINDDGTYFWHLNNLSPSTTYYIQQVVTLYGNSTSDSIGHFNSSTGNIVTSSADQASYDIKHSYTLLSGFPNLTVLPDPDLCAQQRAAAAASGTAGPKICDMNDVINYGLSLLIGLAAVSLVFRLMYEGYRYMTTDIPFLKASSKSGFFAALAGLLIAMTSYIILNTINPKLVSNTVNIAQLSIGIDGDMNVPTVFVGKGQMPAGVYCPGSGRRGAIAQIAQSYKGRVTYSQTNKSATAQSDGFARLDCSSFVNTVLNCAGYKAGTDFVNEGTASIFAKTEKINMANDFVISGNTVTLKGKVLNPGDVVGWPPTSGAGHAIIYIGNGTFMDSHGGTSGRKPGNAIGTYSASDIKKLYGGSSSSKTITSVERMPL